MHATLARVLAEWKLAGWERTYGRAPSADDFIVPTRNMTERPSPDAQYALLLDLAMLGVRPRRGHDLRRTFITLAQVDGARRDLLETITHGPRWNIMNVYTTFPWPALCDEVRKLKIELREGQVLDGDFRGFATGLATAQRNWRNRWRKPATPAGFEKLQTIISDHKTTAKQVVFGDDGQQSRTWTVGSLLTVVEKAICDGDRVAALAAIERARAALNSTREHEGIAAQSSVAVVRLRVI